MVEWDKKIDEKELINDLGKEIIIDFKDINILSSSEVSKLLLILRDCKQKQKTLKLKIQNNYLKELICELGFTKLGACIICD